MARYIRRVRKVIERPTTLAAAVGYVERRRELGVWCPCCSHYVKVWRKKIISTAAASLCRLCSMYAGAPIHLDEFTVLPKDRNFSQLVLWDLIRPGTNTDTGKRASGMWWPTKKGRAFASRRITLPKYVLTDNNEIIGWDGPETDIQDALGRRYDHAELLAENYR